MGRVLEVKVSALSKKKKKKKKGGRSRRVPYNLETEIHFQPGMLWF